MEEFLAQLSSVIGPNLWSMHASAVTIDDNHMSGGTIPCREFRHRLVIACTVVNKDTVPDINHLLPCGSFHVDIDSTGPSYSAQMQISRLMNIDLSESSLTLLFTSRCIPDNIPMKKYLFTWESFQVPKDHNLSTLFGQQKTQLILSATSRIAHRVSDLKSEMIDYYRQKLENIRKMHVHK